MAAQSLRTLTAPRNALPQPGPGDARQFSAHRCLHAVGGDHGPGDSVSQGAQPYGLPIAEPEQLREDKAITLLQNTLIFATQREQLRLLLDEGVQDLLALTQRRFLLVQDLLDP